MVGTGKRNPTGDEMEIYHGRKLKYNLQQTPVYLDEWYALHNPCKAVFSGAESLGRMVGSIPKIVDELSNMSGGCSAWFSEDCCCSTVLRTNNDSPKYPVFGSVWCLKQYPAANKHT